MNSTPHDSPAGTTVWCTRFLDIPDCPWLVIFSWDGSSRDFRLEFKTRDEQLAAIHRLRDHYAPGARFPMAMCHTTRPVTWYEFPVPRAIHPVEIRMLFPDVPLRLRVETLRTRRYFARIGIPFTPGLSEKLIA